MPSTQEKKSLDTVKAAVQKYFFFSSTSQYKRAIEATDISSLIMAESSLTPDQVPDTTLSEILPLVCFAKHTIF